MAENRTSDIDKLREAFARPERISEGALLVGNALASRLTALRGKQAGLEAVRTEARLGADHPETKARQAAAGSLAARHDQLTDEIARQRLTKPPLSDQAGLYGRVTRDGAPAPGLAVSALDDQGTTIVHSCTGRDGDYVLSFPPDQAIRIEVRDESKRLFRDDDAFPYPPYRAVQRDIELAKARPACPEDKPADLGGKTGVPNLIGMKEHAAVATLRGLGLAAGKRAFRKGAEPGIVLDHEPPAGATVAAGSAVDLTLSSNEEGGTYNLYDVEGQSLDKALEGLAKSDSTLGEVKVSTDGGKTPKVQAAEPGAEGKTVDLRISAGTGDVHMTRIMASVLATTPEAAEMSLCSRADTADWLKQRNLTNRGKVSDALNLDDDGLREHLSLDPLDPIGTVRSFLRVVIERIREL
jgi:hypothetical protein